MSDKEIKAEIKEQIKEINIFYNYIKLWDKNLYINNRDTNPVINCTTRIEIRQEYNRKKVRLQPVRNQELSTED